MEDGRNWSRIERLTAWGLGISALTAAIGFLALQLPQPGVTDAAPETVRDALPDNVEHEENAADSLTEDMTARRIDCDDVESAMSSESEERPLESNDAGLTVAVGVANVTCGQDRYSSSTAAKVDDVVQVQLWYANYGEEDLLADVAASLGVDRTEDAAMIVGTVRTGSETDDPAGDFSTVHMSIERAELRYIPGSAIWRKNVAPPGSPAVYEESELSDDLVFGEFSIGRVANGTGGAGTLSALFRSVASVVSIRVEAQDSTGGWVQESTVGRGDRVPMRIVARNEGNVPLSDVLFGANLPNGVSYVRDSLSLSRSAAAPIGLRDAGFTEDGSLIGDVSVGERIELYFFVDVTEEAVDSPRLPLVGWTDAVGLNEFYNVAALVVE